MGFDVKKILFVIALSTLIGGCAGNSMTEYPIGIGPGPNSLKRSPCACIQLPNLAQSQQG